MLIPLGIKMQRRQQLETERLIKQFLANRLVCCFILTGYQNNESIILTSNEIAYQIA